MNRPWQRDAVNPLDGIVPVASSAEIVELIAWARAVHVAPAIEDYAVALSRATRGHSDLRLGASPRASLALMKMSQALALMDGQDFVTPEQIQELAVPVIAHRLVMEPQARFSGQTARAVVEEVIKKVRVPA